MEFVIVRDVVLVGNLDVKFAKSCVVLQCLFPGLLIRNIGLFFVYLLLIKCGIYVGM